MNLLSAGPSVFRVSPTRRAFQAWPALAVLAAAAALSGCQPSQGADDASPRLPNGVAPAPAPKVLPAPQVAIKHLSETVLPPQQAASAPAVKALPVATAVSGQVAKLMDSDKNKDGSLNFDEFHTALGQDIAPPVMKKLFGRVDLNQDGKLAPAELQAYVEPGTRATDANHNGYLDENDVASLRAKPATSAGKAGAEGAEGVQKKSAAAAPSGSLPGASATASVPSAGPTFAVSPSSGAKPANPRP